jgi:GT2 family glycosyltransferase
VSRALRVAAIVPTVGASPHLERSLDALLSQSGVALTLTLVEQRPARGRVPSAARRLPAAAGRGFAAAANAGLAATDEPLVALVNDDAVVAPEWLERLCAALLEAPELAAVQGTHRLGIPRGDERAARRLDGVGIAFNRWWQAVQIGRDRPLPDAPASLQASAPMEVLGVSATAALYRRAALEQARPATWGAAAFFDEGLESYYEDVDLACRLRGAGLRAAWVPGAVVDHAGSASAGAAPGAARDVLLARNRPLVVARLLGRRFPAALPRLLARDLADLRRGGPGPMLAAWAGAARRLPRFAHAGPPLISRRTLLALAAEAADAELSRRLS